MSILSKYSYSIVQKCQINIIILDKIVKIIVIKIKIMHISVAQVPSTIQAGKHQSFLHLFHILVCYLISGNTHVKVKTLYSMKIYI